MWRLKCPICKLSPPQNRNLDGFLQKGNSMKCPICSRPLSTVIVDTYKFNHMEEVEIRCVKCDSDYTELAIDYAIERDFNQYKENNDENIQQPRRTT